MNFTCRVIILNLKKMKTLPQALLTLLASQQHIKAGVNVAAQLNVLTRLYPETTFDFDGLLELGDLFKCTDLRTLAYRRLGLSINKLDDSQAQSINRPQIEYLTYMAWANLQLGNMYRTNPAEVETLANTNGQENPIPGDPATTTTEPTPPEGISTNDTTSVPITTTDETPITTENSNEIKETENEEETNDNDNKEKEEGNQNEENGENYSALSQPTMARFKKVKN